MKEIVSHKQIIASKELRRRLRRKKRSAQRRRRSNLRRKFEGTSLGRWSCNV